MEDKATVFTRYPTRIIVENFECYHNNESKEKLKRSLSVWDKITYSYTFSGFLYDDETDTLIIPGGYNPDYLFSLFPDCKFYDKRKSTMNRITKNTVDYELKVKPRNITQTKAIKFLLNEKYYQKYLSLQTSQGKTYCAVNYVHEKNLIPIVIIDRDALMQQWVERIKQYTSLSDENIYLISGRKSIDKLYHMKDEELNKIAYFIAINKTLQILFEESMENMENLFDYLGIGIKIYDEAHESFQFITYLDESTDCESLYLSATPSRSNPQENKVYRNIFNYIPMIKGEIKNKYTSVLFYTIQSKCPILEIANFNKKRGFNVIGYTDWLFNNRQKMVKNIIKRLVDKSFLNLGRSRKIAILFKKNSHIDMVKKYLEEELIPNSSYNNLTVGVINGKTKDKLKEQEHDIILSTDSSFNKAIDVEGLEILINFVPVGSIERTNQIFGRLRYIEGRNTMLIDIVDESVESIVGMCNLRLSKFYNQNAKSIKKMRGETYDE